MRRNRWVGPFCDRGSEIFKWFEIKRQHSVGGSGCWSRSLEQSGQRVGCQSCCSFEEEGAMSGSYHSFSGIIKCFVCRGTDIVTGEIHEWLL